MNPFFLYKDFLIFKKLKKVANILIIKYNELDRTNHKLS